MKLKVNELTRAEREGRTHRGKVVPVEAAAENGEEASKEEGSEEEGSTDEDGEHISSHLDEAIDSTCCPQYSTRFAG